MIENFSIQEFVKALPPIGGTPWQQEGVDRGQVLFTCRPIANGKYGLLCWSSIDPGTLCSAAGAGYDSIRAACCEFKEDDQGCTVIPYGGKAERWTDRRNGWQRRLRQVLTTLAAQLKAIGPCPHCQVDTVPMTAKTAANKGRPFVACCNKRCPNKPTDKPFGYFAWTDKAPDSPATASKPTSEGQGSLNGQESTGATATATETVFVPCDQCGKRCKVFVAGPMAANAGRKFISCDKGRGGCGRWTFITDEEIAVAQGCTVAQPSIGLEEAKREQRRLWEEGGEAAAIGMAAVDTQGCTVKALEILASVAQRLDALAAGGVEPDEPELLASQVRHAMRLLGK